MSEDEEAFVLKVMRQLPGVAEPRIMVHLDPRSVTSPEQDAQTAAEHFQEPVAIASMDGRLLAYRVPKNGDR